MKDSLKEIMAQTETAGAGKALQDWLRHRTREALLEIVEEEVSNLCGPRHFPSENSDCYRAGSTPSSLYLGSDRQEMNRPRVRRRKGDTSEEVVLKSWKMARDPEEWEQAMMRAVLCGVSCRGIGKLRESEIRGESKSSLSRLWQRKAGVLVEEMQTSDLSGFDMLVLMLDGVVLCKNLVATVALAIDVEGNKRLLGFRIGSSENTEVCTDLLTQLKHRGLRVGRGRKLLAILDGSQALKNAILKHYPGTLVQRCLIHKERNLRGYLARQHWKELANLFKRLRRSQGEEDGLEAASQIEVYLSTKNVQAQESFAEPGDDLLTLFRLSVPNSLNVPLLSTNAIENAFKNLRRHIGRVARWREETHQADRWVASGLLLAQRTFRRVRAYQDLHLLQEALEKAAKQPKQAHAEPVEMSYA